MIPIPDWQSWCLLRHWVLYWYRVVSFLIFFYMPGVCFCFLTLLQSHMRPAAPDSYHLLFQWASTLLVRFERLGNFLWMSTTFWSLISAYIPTRKLKICGWDPPKIKYVVWPTAHRSGFCLGWIQWKSACPKPNSTLTASLLVLIFHIQPWCSLRLRFAAGILTI